MKKLEIYSEVKEFRVPRAKLGLLCEVLEVGKAA